jgi:hypothetical protein
VSSRWGGHLRRTIAEPVMALVLSAAGCAPDWKVDRDRERFHDSSPVNGRPSILPPGLHDELKLCSASTVCTLRD